MGIKEKVKKYWVIFILVFLVASNVFIWYIVLREDRHGILTFAVLDIGQGDGLFIEAPNGNQIMIDGGPDGIVLRKLGEVMPFYDRSVNMLIVSNPDKDHMSGFIDVLNSYHVDAVMEPGTQSPSATYKALEATIRDKKATRILAKRGMRLILAPNVFLYILFPDRDVSTQKTNDGSIVAKLVYGKTSIMLMGDAPQKIEKYLIKLDGSNLRSDILKAGHHGSRTSTSQEFVEQVKPTYAAISAGLNNKYGHPHKETVQTLNKLHVPIFTTLGKGTLYFQSDGNFWKERQL